MKKILTLLLFILMFCAQGQNIKKVYKLLSKEKNDKALIEIKRFNQSQKYSGPDLLLLAYASQYILTTPVAYDPIAACEQFHSLHPNENEINKADQFLKKYGFSREKIKDRINKHAFALAKDNIDLWDNEAKKKVAVVKNCISDEKLLEQLQIHEIRRELKDVPNYHPDNIKKFADKVRKIKKDASYRKEIINEKTREVTFIHRDELAHVADSAYKVARGELGSSLSEEIRKKDLNQTLKILKKYSYFNKKNPKTDHVIQTIFEKEINTEISTCNCEMISNYQDKLRKTSKYLLPKSKAELSNKINKLEADCKVQKQRTISYNKAQYNLKTIPINKNLSFIDDYVDDSPLEEPFTSWSGPIVKVGENLFFPSGNYFNIIQGEFESFNTHHIYGHTVHDFKEIHQVGSNLFQKNGIFIQRGYDGNDFYRSLAYIDLKGCIKGRNGKAIKIVSVVERNSEFGVHLSNKTYSFKVDNIKYVGNSNDNYYIMALKAHPIQGGNYVLALKRLHQGYNLYDVGAILENFQSPTKTTYYFNGDLSRTYTKWDIQDLFLLRSKNIAVVIQITENYERYDPRINIPIPHKFKTSLVVIFDEQGKIILSKNKIIEADYYIPSKNGGFYALVEKGGFLSKYDANGNFEWNVSLGLSDERNVGHDVVKRWTETDDKLYLGGYSLAKGHVGKEDPIIYEVLLSNHTFKSHLIRTNKANQSIAGLVMLNNQLFYRIGGMMYNFEKNK